jgi:antirestriction protein ArdC
MNISEADWKTYKLILDLAQDRQWLEMQWRGAPGWMTYKQAQGVGAQVRRGEKGTLVQYWKLNGQIAVKDERGQPLKDAEGNPVYRTVQLDKPKVFSAAVFNAEQIEGLPPLEIKTPERRPPRARRGGADGLRRRDPPRPGRPRLLPPGHGPDSPAGSGQLQERRHLLRHRPPRAGPLDRPPSRLDRDLAHPFGSVSYAKEELRAEIASLMIGDRLGIGHDPGQHAAYVKSWVQVLKEDPKEVLRASRDADKISNYVLGLEKTRMPVSIEKPPEVSQEQPQGVPVRFLRGHFLTMAMGTGR